MDGTPKIKPTLVRLPDELKEWLKQRAAENFRSMNGEIVARLQESMTEEKRKKEE
jgi:plasmid stability protein